MIRGAASIAMAGLLALGSTGCGPIGVAIPWYSYESIPDVGGHVPADFGSSGREILAMATIVSASKFGPSRTNISRPVIVKRDELSLLKSSFNARAKGGPMGFGTNGWANDTGMARDTLLDLCLVAADGRTLTLSGPDGQGWSNVRQGIVNTKTRDAMVEALGRDKPIDPSSFDWPCAGTMHWGEIERAQVTDFIRGIRP